MANAIHINMQNLKDFQDWLLSLRERNYAENIYLDLPLDVVLNGAPKNLSQSAQEALAYIIAGDRGSRDLARDVNFMLDNADRFPHLLGRAYSCSGNTRTGYAYGLIMDAIKKRPIDTNIAAIYAMLQYDRIRSSNLGTGMVSKTSHETARMLNEIFKGAMQNRTNTDDFDARAWEALYNVDMFQFLNFDAALPQVRAYINKRTLGERNHTAFELLDKIDTKLLDEKALKTLIETNRLVNKPGMQETANAKTQAEKNVNILPKYYTKTRDALIQLIEREEIHDPDNYGRQKTLTQRFKDVVTRLMNAREWSPRLLNNNSLLNDVYLQMLQRDIINGRAADLKSDEIELVLKNDLRGFYADRIDSKNKNDNINIVYDKRATAAKKRDAIAQMESRIAGTSAEYEALAAEIEQYDQDMKVVKQLGERQLIAEQVYKVLDRLQREFATIRREMKDGTPIAGEEHLTPNAAEILIYNYLTSVTNSSMIPEPKYGSLPLLFGRKEEQARRQRMIRTVQDFNRTLKDIRGTLYNTNITAKLAEYYGKLLSPDSLRASEDEYLQIKLLHDDADREFKETHRDRFHMSKEYAEYKSHNDSLARAKAHMAEHAEKTRAESRRQLGMDQTEKLTPVTHDMTPEDKAKARARNKKIATDRLAGRKPGPSKNMAEYIHKGDIER